MIHCSGIFGANRIIGNTSENIKCGHLKKKYGNLPKRGRKGNDWTVFNGNFSNKIMQNYRKFFPQTGVMVITPDAVVTENG